MEASTHVWAQSFLLVLKRFFGSDALSLILSTGKMCACKGGGGGGEGDRMMTRKPASFLLTAQL